MKNELSTTDKPSQANAMIQMAIDKGMGAEELREFLAARREWEADEARKEYFKAVSNFQRDAPIIEKLDKAHNKQYAALDRIWRTVRPLMADNGLSVTWHTCTIADGVCRVAGHVAHRDGHCVELVRDVPLPAIVTGQNAAQQAGSAETYGKRYALCAALGIVTGEDDDASACGETITAKQMTELSDLLDKVDNRDKVLTDLLDWACCDTLEDLPASKFAAAKKALNAKL